MVSIHHGLYVESLKQATQLKETVNDSKETMADMITVLMLEKAVKKWRSPLNFISSQQFPTGSS